MEVKQLRQNNLFSNLTEAEFNHVLDKSEYRKVQAKEIISKPGDKMTKIYILVEGKVEVYSYDLSGNKKMVTIFEEGEMFGESVALGIEKISPFFIETITATTLLSLCYQEVEKERFPYQLIKNLLKIVATKNQFLTHKIECLNKGTIEERVYEVLHYYHVRQKSYQIKLPYSKTQLAEYLCVNRSALSREMAKMENQGIFKSDKREYFLNPEYFKS